MREFKNGTLKSSDGKKVTSRKQALAIAMSESEDYAEKADLISAIHIGSVREAEQILKAAGTEGDLFEKAHKDGDMHPNGKWVWRQSANGGKGDWRVAKPGGSKSTAGGAAATTKTNTAAKTSSSTLSDKEKNTFADIMKKNSSHKDAHMNLEQMSDDELRKFANAASVLSGDKTNLNDKTRANIKGWMKLAQDEQTARRNNKKTTGKQTDGKTSEVNEETLKKQLKEFGGKLLGLQTKDGVIGIHVQFGSRDYYAADDFVKKHKEWRATTNTGNNYEFVYLNKEGKEALRKRGFKGIDDNEPKSTKKRTKTTKKSEKPYIYNDGGMVGGKTQIKDEAGLLKVLNGAKSNTVLIYDKDWKGLNSEAKKIGEKNGWKVEVGVDKEGNLSSTGSYIIFKKKTK